MSKKIKVPQKITKFFEENLVEYKRIGKSKEHQFVIKAKVNPFNKHTGLNLKELELTERRTWQKEIVRVENTFKKEIVRVENTFKKEIVRVENTFKKEIVRVENTFKKEIVRVEKTLNEKIDRNAEAINEIKNLILNLQENMNSRMDSIESKVDKIDKRIDNIVAKNNLKE